MRAATQKLTTAAVCTALSVICCAATAYLPLSFMPLYLAAFCIFLACKRANIVYGILCAVATVGIMFAFSGLSVKWFVLLVMFAPYGVIASFIQRYNYFKVKSGIVRGLCVAAYFNVTFAIVYLVASRVLTGGIVDGNDIAVIAWANTLGGYAVLAVIMTVVLVSLDFIFTALAAVVLKRIPAPVDRRKASHADKQSSVENGAADTTRADAPPKAQGSDVGYDIFGYETIREDPSKRDDDNKDEKNDGMCNGDDENGGGDGKNGA